MHIDFNVVTFLVKKVCNTKLTRCIFVSFFWEGGGVGRLEKQYNNFNMSNNS